MAVGSLALVDEVELGLIGFYFSKLGSEGANLGGCGINHQGGLTDLHDRKVDGQVFWENQWTLHLLESIR